MRVVRSPEPVLAALARFAVQVERASLSATLLDHVGVVVADTLGAILGGSGEPEMRALHARAGRQPGPATLLGNGFPTAEPWWAIVANGTAGTMLELDEGNRFARGHPAVHVLPAALAEAERLDRSGAQLVEAFVIGYEVAARLGGAAPVRPGLHMHGVHGVVGAAAAVARLRGLDEAATGDAMAVAAGLTLTTSWRTALAGATVRNAYAGVGGANGWLAVDLAEAGLTGLPDMLPETFGRISAAGLDAAFATDALGERFEVARNYFKLYACCRFNHPAVEALEAILAGEAVPAEAVAEIRVATTLLAATMNDRDPRGSLGAKFSIPYSLAARLVLGGAGPEAFREPALSDVRIRALARRVAVEEDPRLTAMQPDRRPARVEVRLEDGRRLVHQVDTPCGEFDRPYPRARLRQKFVALATPALGSDGAAAWTLATGIGEAARVRDVLSALRDLAGR